MHPALLSLDPDLCPHMIGPIVDESSLVTKRHNQSCEAVCPFAAAAISGLEELNDLVVSWVPEGLIAARTEVYLHTPRHPFDLLWRWVTGSLRLYLTWVARLAASTLRFVRPFEEVPLVPGQESL